MFPKLKKKQIKINLLKFQKFRFWDKLFSLIMITKKLKVPLKYTIVNKKRIKTIFFVKQSVIDILNCPVIVKKNSLKNR